MNLRTSVYRPLFGELEFRASQCTINSILLFQALCRERFYFHVKRSNTSGMRTSQRFNIFTKIVRRAQQMRCVVSNWLLTPGSRWSDESLCTPPNGNAAVSPP